MKFLNHIRPRSKVKSPDGAHGHSRQISHPYFHNPNTSFRPNPTARFPLELLQELFAYVCPHARDETYVSSEDSMLDGGCMLCDMRDLAHCVAINKQWNHAAQTVLYHSIRIDAVHYCDREYDLAHNRKRKSFTGRTGDFRDPAHERLALLSRTLRDNPVLAVEVQYLKIPVMTREPSKADLARAVSVLPNLRFVDLPDSVYTSNSTAKTLKLELQARCPDIRKMKYMSGSEDSFTQLGRGGQWRNLEILELNNLTVDPSTLSHVTTSLSALTSIILVNVPTIDNPALGSLPPVPNLTIKDSPEISIGGLANYLSHPSAPSTLTSLTLSNTSIPPSTLNQILASAPHLSHLSTTESVSRPLPATPPPPLASKSLRTLHYELSSSPPSRGPASSPTDSYYTYLATSIHAAGLPRLSHLYALSITLPSLLLSPPPPTNQPSTHRKTLSSTNPFSTTLPPTTLNLFTKTTPELEWNLTVLTPSDLFPHLSLPSHTHSITTPATTTNNSNTISNVSNARRGSPPKTRPLSLYHPPELSPQWRGKGAEGVLVGNGFGGFLMVPGKEAAGGREREGRGEEWMG